MRSFALTNLPDELLASTVLSTMARSTDEGRDPGCGPGYHLSPRYAQEIQTPEFAADWKACGDAER